MASFTGCQPASEHNSDIIAAILTIILITFLIHVWKHKLWKLNGRIYFTLIVISATAYIWVLNYWKFLGFHF